MHGKRLGFALALCLAPALSGAAAAKTYQIGGMFTYTYHDGRYADWGNFAIIGVRIAVEEMNASGLLGRDKLQLKDENVVDYHCWPEGSGEIADSLLQRGIIALIGVDCSGPAVRIAKVAERYQVPAISYSANAASLTSPEKFPYFVRVVTSSSAYESYLIDLAAHFGLKRIALFHTTDAWGAGAREAVHKAAEKYSIEVAAEYGYPRDTTLEVVREYVAEIKTKGLRAIVITAPTPDTVVVFRALNALDMNKPGTTIFAAEMTSADETPDAINGAYGYFAPMTKLYPSKRLDAFTAALEKRIGSKADPNSKAFFYAVLGYDHVLAVGHAIKDAKAAGEKAITGKVVVEYLRKMDFEGASGRIRIAPHTNDRADMAVEILNCQGYKDDGKTVNFVPVGFVDPITGKLTLDESKIVWPGHASR